MKANDCKMFVHNHLLNLRSLFHTVTTEKFQKLFEELPENRQQAMWAAIQAFDADEVERLIREFSIISLETMTVRDLRNLAKSYGIRGYAFLPKSSLLSALYLRERANEKSQTCGDDSADDPPLSGIGNPPKENQRPEGVSSTSLG